MKKHLSALHMYTVNSGTQKYPFKSTATSLYSLVTTTILNLVTILIYPPEMDQFFKFTILAQAS